jgi:hypothetical protein
VHADVQRDRHRVRDPQQQSLRNAGRQAVGGHHLGEGQRQTARPASTPLDPALERALGVGARRKGARRLDPDGEGQRTRRAGQAERAQAPAAPTGQSAASQAEHRSAEQRIPTPEPLRIGEQDAERLGAQQPGQQPAHAAHSPGPGPSGYPAR